MSFPCSVLESGVGPCLSGFAPMPFQNLRVTGLPPAGLFSGSFGVWGGTVQVYSLGTGLGWRAAVSRGAALADGPLIWSPSSGDWSGTILAPCPPGPPISYLVRWVPEAFCSVAMNRNVVDEEVDGGTACLSWDRPLVLLNDARYTVTERTTGIWDTPPAAGPFHKVGTCPLPRAGGQRMRFEF